MPPTTHRPHTVSAKEIRKILEERAGGAIFEQGLSVLDPADPRIEAYEALAARSHFEHPGTAVGGPQEQLDARGLGLDGAAAGEVEQGSERLGLHRANMAAKPSQSV